VEEVVRGRGEAFRSVVLVIMGQGSRELPKPDTINGEKRR